MGAYVSAQLWHLFGIYLVLAWDFVYYLNSLIRLLHIHNALVVFWKLRYHRTVKSVINLENYLHFYCLATYICTQIRMFSQIRIYARSKQPIEKRVKDIQGIFITCIQIQSWNLVLEEISIYRYLKRNHDHLAENQEMHSIYLLPWRKLCTAFLA